MKKYQRVFIALAIFLSGLALVPYLGLSAERIEWQRYAGAYEVADVQIVDFAFVPDLIVVPRGTTVRWTNMGAVPHTVTSDTALFDSGTLQPGESFEYTFTTLGSYGYFCSLHPEMTGTVMVVFRVYLPIVAR
jgi:plastocyanin